MVTGPNGMGLGDISLGELAARAARVRLVLTDCDGVLTDAGVYYSARGEELKRFSFRDGMGFERLRDAGVDAAIVTRESSPIVERRAEKLRLRVYGGVLDKAQLLPRILADTGRAADEIAYMGDDVNDLGIIAAIGVAGLTAAPGDAEPVVLDKVHLRGTRPGGFGAFRQFADAILQLKPGGTP